MNTKTVLAISIAFMAIGCSPDRDHSKPVDPQAQTQANKQYEGEGFKAIRDASNAVDAAAERSLETDERIDDSEANKQSSDDVDTMRPLITVHKTATCGCCSAWVDHLKGENFEVKVVDHPELGAIKKKMGVPQHLHSCHTGEINGLFVEGHVPGGDIREMIKLAKQDKAIDGIAVPGMPMGSPGMEAGGAMQPYDVIMLAGQEESVLNSHGTR